MEQIALIIFLVTYAGVAVGGIPGLALDRTGIALLGAIAMVAPRSWARARPSTPSTRPPSSCSTP